ncbi:MAG: biopolymer transporter ExbD [Kiritimatiellae bacterium]|nr:biopolymer transporter ExbD [Kiritimatiellia bacterium]
MRLSSGYEDRKARIEMLPLMDVMFLILVFFIYSVFSMSVHRGLKVDLPAVKGLHMKGEQIIVNLTAESEFFVNKQPMAFDDAVSATVALWQETGAPVLISADKAAALGTGIELLGKLKIGGVDRVAFQVSGVPHNAPAAIKAQ